MPFIQDGYQTLVQFSGPVPPGSIVCAKEKEVQPIDIDGLGEIDTTTMRNAKWRTKNPKSLITAGEMTLQVNYDPTIYSQFVTSINVNQFIIVTFPDGTQLGFYGWISKFTPASLKEGEFPLAEIKVMCSNRNNTYTPSTGQVAGGYGEAGPTILTYGTKTG
jgi:hypothetical protein